MITYNETKGKISVTLDGKLAGYIEAVEKGFQYIPLGQPEGGEVFSTIGGCKKSLE